MSRAVSPSANKPYGLARVCRIWKIPRSSVYEARDRAGKGRPAPKKRGPKPWIPDKDLLKRIREVLEKNTWTGEGYRKVWARLRFQGIRVSQKRVLRLMREHSLLAKERPVPSGHSKDHKGTIIPERPNKIWGTDATSTWTEEGNATIFFVIDHFSADCLGIHAARRGTRFEALVPFRQAIRTIFGDFKEGIAGEEDLLLRHDHGSQFVSRAYQAEIRFVGVTSSPAYVREPETNGCAERFVKTLKEQLLWPRRFKTIEELNSALQKFMHDYNKSWIIQRHGYLTPSQARKQALEREEMVA